jgi:hypothetical protein
MKKRKQQKPIPLTVRQLAKKWDQFNLTILKQGGWKLTKQPNNQYACHNKFMVFTVPTNSTAINEVRGAAVYEMMNITRQIIRWQEQTK